MATVMQEEHQNPELPSLVSKKEVRKPRLLNSKSYRMMKKVALYMDQYYLDGVAGLVPGGLGDMMASAFALVHVYFSLYKLRSVPLTLAVLNNAMRDVLMGMLPFFVGDVIDFFNKSHAKNMKLIDGYIYNYPHVVHELHRKAWQSAAVLVLLLVAIVGMVWFLVWLTKTLGTALFS